MSNLGERKNESFLYDHRYDTRTGIKPVLARLRVAENQIRVEPIEIPRSGKGVIQIRLLGQYTAHDGEVLLDMRHLHAEVYVVHRGFQFAIWWGDPAEFARQEPWLVDFMNGCGLGAAHVMPALEHQQQFLRQHPTPTGAEESVLADLLQQLRIRLSQNSPCVAVN